jgi:mono/diheme cytochrome c family protein
MGPEGPLPGRELSGTLIVEDATMSAWSRNITPAGRIATWSDAELARAIREGIRPDGTLVGPPMPFLLYRGISDNDLAAIVAFLRTVPAVPNEVPASVFRFPLPPAWGPPVASVPDIPRAATVEYGAYIAGPIAHCLECHTPMGPQGPMFDTALGRGGFEFNGPWGTSVAANITGHADGLAGRTDAEIERMIREGERPDGSRMLPPMPYYFLARMTETDMKALILYLRTLPPLPDGG